MKVRFRFGIRTYSGTIDDMTYGSYRRNKLCIGREWVLPILTPQNTELGASMANLAVLWAAASNEYKADFKTYSVKYASEQVSIRQLPPTGFSLFIKAMWAWAEDEGPTLDLKSVTIEDVGTLGGKVASVAACVTNGYLPEVEGSGDMDSPI